ncbi:MAG: SGNH/GDSL hydrolase family protein [Nitrospinae bacterium]|nr:SGNH/GDSL hydrolase family protein [Nitrospinota bacterium]
MPKKVLFLILMFLIPVAVLSAFLEFAAPLIIKTPHLVYKEWPGRPVTFHPGMKHRAVTDYYDNWFTANPLGFNDTEHAPAKPAGVVRILILGDSFVEALQVKPEENAARVMERLAEERGMALEAVSMGMSGYGQGQQLKTYETIGKTFNPDMVVIYFCANDLNDNMERPEYSLSPDGKLMAVEKEIPAESWKTALVRGLLNRLESYFIVKEVFGRGYRLFFATAEEVRAARTAQAGVAGGGGIDEGALAHYAEPEKLKSFETLVKSLHETVTVRDGKPLVAALVSAGVVSPSLEFEKFLDEMEKVYHEAGVDTLNLQRLFVERYRREKTPPHFERDVHWNAVGHLWAAGAILERVEKQLGAKGVKNG